MNKRKIINSVIDIIFVVCIGIIYFEWSSHLMQSWAPDEGMREDVVYWIAKNGRLPIGDEKELINPIWGFSYAFLPYLPSIIGAFYVKIISIFTSSEIAIFLAFCIFVSKEVDLVPKISEISPINSLNTPVPITISTLSIEIY